MDPGAAAIGVRKEALGIERFRRSQSRIARLIALGAVGIFSKIHDGKIHYGKNWRLEVGAG